MHVDDRQKARLVITFDTEMHMRENDQKIVEDFCIVTLCKRTEKVGTVGELTF